MTDGYSVSTAVGRVIAGELDNIWIPRSPRPGKRGVVLVHGSGAPQAYVDPVAQPASVRMAAELAANGIPCIAGAFGGNMWGNNTVIAAITTAWNVLKAQFPLMRTDKVILVAGSMGGAAATRYAQLNPSSTAAVVGMIPAYDLKHEYQNVPGVVAAIEAAWGFSGIGNYPTAADLKTTASLAAGVPHLTAYAPDDTIVLPAGVIGYNTAVGGTLYNLGNLGHTDAAIAAMPVSTIAQFIVGAGA